MRQKLPEDQLRTKAIIVPVSKKEHNDINQFYHSQGKATATAARNLLLAEVKGNAK